MKEQPTRPTADDPALAAQLRAAAARPDAETDLSDPDAPETLDWSRSVVGRFHAMAVRPTLVRVDDDLAAYFAASGPGFEARVNAALRSVVAREQGREEASPDRP